MHIIDCLNTYLNMNRFPDYPLKQRCYMRGFWNFWSCQQGADGMTMKDGCISDLHLKMWKRSLSAAIIYVHKFVKDDADARMLLRQFMLERFLERLSLSRYKDNFVIKGGMLVTSLIGIALRSTMDIDTTISGFDLTIDETTKVINEIMSIELDDGVRFDKKYGADHIEESLDFN